MFGQYKRLRNQFEGVLTGKGYNWGGSFLRPEATGYGCVYFVNYMLEGASKKLKGLTAAVSGSGNVAQYAVEKLIQLGAKPLTMSDSTGTIYVESGIDKEILDCVMQVKNVERKTLKSVAERMTGVSIRLLSDVED